MSQTESEPKAEGNSSEGFGYREILRVLFIFLAWPWSWYQLHKEVSPFGDKEIRKKDKRLVVVGGLLIQALTIAVALFVAHNLYQFQQDRVTITVTKAEVSGGRSVENFVYTTSKETYIVDDSWVEWWEGNPMAFRSRDTFGEIEVGKTYQVRVRGIRWPFWSWHRNIVEVLPPPSGAETVTPAGVK